MKKILLCSIAALMALFTFTSCEKEEEVALDIAGTWETPAGFFTRTYKEHPLKTQKTVFYLHPERKGLTVGEGVAVEYYDNTELPVAYFHIKWSTWSRQNGDVGIELQYEETTDVFSTIDYKLKGSSFSGHLFNSETTFNFARGTEPDVKNVKFWGYNELMPTWHQATYEGQVLIKREADGKIYRPKQFVITFDCEPAYNNGSVGVEKAYVKEVYEDDAPWGNVLADSIRFWDYYKDTNHMSIYLASNPDAYTPDYEFYDFEVTESEIKGSIFIETNVFEPFTLRRTSNPDWSSINKWGMYRTR